VSYDELLLTADLKLDFAEGIKVEADLNVSYKELNEAIKLYFIDDVIYLDYDDASLMISIEDLMVLLEKYAEIDLSSSSISLDINSIITTVLSIDFNELLKDFTLAEEKLGLTIGLTQFVETMSDIQIEITKTTGVNLSVIMDNLAIGTTLSTFEGEIVLDGEYNDLSNIDFIIEDVLSIIEAKKVKLELSGAYENITLNTEAYIDFTNSITVSADITLSNGSDNVTLKLTYLEDVIYLDFYNVKLSISVDELTRLLQKYGVSLTPSENASAVSIIDTILTIDFAQLLEELTILEDSMSITVNLEQFIADMEAIKLSINNSDEGLDLSVNMFDINVAVSTFDHNITVSDGYQNLGYLDFIVDDVIAIINSQKVKAEVNGSYENIDLAVEAYVDWSSDLQLQAIIKLAKEDKEINLTVSYIGNVVYLEFYNVKACIAVEDLMEILGKSGVSLDLNTDTISIEEIINIIFEIDYSKLIKEFVILDNNISFTVGLEQFVADMDDITLSIKNTDNGLSLSVDMFDITCDVEAYDGSIILSGEYMDLSNLYFIVEDVLAIVKGEKVEAILTGAYEGINLNVVAYVDWTNELALRAIITVSNADKEINLTVTYKDGVVYIDFYNVHISASIEEVMGLLEENGVSIDLGNEEVEMPEINVSDIIDILFTIDYESLVKNFNIEGEALSITLGLAQFISDMADITLGINNTENGLDLNVTYDVFNVEAEVNTTEYEITITEEYSNICDLYFIVEDVLAIVKGEKVEAILTGAYEGINLNVVAYVDWTNE
ncbi:MAG: hypothetical protein J6R47_05895, partial [Acholeplasmatales bacterium]|nr:hypothetical protein [Acholeplasmatales bacterium]